MKVMTGDDTPLWPLRLRKLCAELRNSPGGMARTEIWVLIRDALMRYLRVYSGRARGVRREDVEDLAGTKALELVQRAESGEWDPEGRGPDEIAGYLAAVARHGVWRLVEKQSRETDLPDARSGGIPVDVNGGKEMDLTPSPPLQEAAVEAGEFVEALRECVVQLKPAARRVWFFRAFYEMSSRDIAAHPEVGLNAAHVDVIVQRVREALKSCLDAKGFLPREYPAGTFSALWETMDSMSRSPAHLVGVESDHAD
jgi:RNA polymerase sigma factor (sigma-70 family)